MTLFELIWALLFLAQPLIFAAHWHRAALPGTGALGLALAILGLLAWIPLLDRLDRANRFTMLHTVFTASPLLILSLACFSLRASAIALLPPIAVGWLLLPYLALTRPPTSPNASGGGGGGSGWGATPDGELESHTNP